MSKKQRVDKLEYENCGDVKLTAVSRLMTANNTKHYIQCTTHYNLFSNN
jgi:hypothetical protein